jgi:Ni,Fe-hydrogenase III component G
MNWIDIPAETIRQYTGDLIATGEFRHLSTITGYQDGERICILYHFLDQQGALNVRTCVPLADPVLPSISPVLIGAILYEREIQDLLGVRFEGIVDGRRVILPEHFPPDVFPLRKDFKKEDLP